MRSSEVTKFVSTLLVLCVISHAEPSSEKHKLLTWIEENSDVFVMLMHWKDLPLISTAWKRLKMTSQVQEDRKYFLESVGSFFETTLDKMQTKIKSANQSNISSETASQSNITSSEAVSSFVTSRDDVDKMNLEMQLNGNLTSDSNTSQDNNVQLTATNDKQFLNHENITTTTFRNRSLLNPSCSCNEPEMDSKIFLANYEEEKRWIRSQLTPLNYLFEKLKAIEEKFDNLQKVTCANENFEKIKLNLTLGPETNNSQEFQIRIDNLESLSKTFSSEFRNLSAMVMSIQESTKSAKQNLDMLLSHASNIVTVNAGRNNTEDVEYCPENLDEKVSCSEVGNSCYCFSKLQKNWTAAQNYCRENDMFLLSLETEKETQLIGDHIKSSGLPRDFYWTSGSDEATEGHWVWTSTQQNMTFENWRSNQPDGGLKENCLYIHSRDDFKWGDWICNVPQYFICEW